MATVRLDPATCAHDRQLVYGRDVWRCMDCYLLHEAPVMVAGTVVVPAAAVAALRAWVTAAGGTWEEVRK